MLNDSVYLGAERHLAWRMQQPQNNAGVMQLFNAGYTCWYINHESVKLAALQNLNNTAYLQYKNNAAAAAESPAERTHKLMRNCSINNTINEVANFA
jgi:hypothetical protein